MRNLYKRAVGFSYDEVHYEQIKPGIAIKASKEEISEIKAMPQYKVKVYTKYIYPDVDAQKYWLSTRCPEEWREKKEVNFNINFAQELKTARERSRLGEFSTN